MSRSIYEEASEYHSKKPYGKVAVNPTKPMKTRHDLSLAYTPGVAGVCLEIATDPSKARIYTSRSHLVGVISNGTAVLGLGDIGALASKPVMEGKAILFKKFAGIDAFDIEINERDPEKLVDIIASLEPTFGGINLEDIKAPECFYIEEELKKRMNIPVFHDDQHGTAIVVAAGLINALEIAGKSMDKVKVVVSGAGSAAIACLQFLKHFGLDFNNVFVCDSRGVIHHRRDIGTLDASKRPFIQETHHESLSDVMEGADVFLGLSKKDLLTPEDIKKMNPNPIVFALANPDPEILPDVAHSTRPDVIMATGRSDFHNQINNSLCFPYLFKGALDVGATSINTEMKMALAKALASIAKQDAGQDVLDAYGSIPPYGRDYFIPKMFDRRLYTTLTLAVAKEAIATGSASYPVDIQEYQKELEESVKDLL